MIICDTREKANEKILRYFDQNSIDYSVQKLDTGDYMLDSNRHLTIDRKKDLGELSFNLFSADKSRFWREIRRAKDNDIKMIILCEHGGRIKSMEDVAGFKNKYSKVSGRTLMERIYSVHIAYGIDFLFCDKRSTGKRIIELLGA